MRGRDPRTTGQLDTFLNTLRESGIVTLAAKAAGLHRQSLYRIRDTDPEFASAWDSALEEAYDLLE